MGWAGGLWAGAVVAVPLPSTTATQDGTRRRMPGGRSRRRRPRIGRTAALPQTGAPDLRQFRADVSTAAWTTAHPPTRGVRLRLRAAGRLHRLGCQPAWA